MMAGPATLRPLALGIAAHLALALGCVVVFAAAPDPSGQVALVFRPGTSFADAFRGAVAAGARPIRPGRVDWIIVVLPERPAAFAHRAHQHGVLAVVNPMLAGGCVAPARRSTIRQL